MLVFRGTSKQYNTLYDFIADRNVSFYVKLYTLKIQPACTPLKLAQKINRKN